MSNLMKPIFWVLQTVEEDGNKETMRFNMSERRAVLDVGKEKRQNQVRV